MGAAPDDQQPTMDNDAQYSEYADEDSEPSTGGGQSLETPVEQPATVEPSQDLNTQPVQPQPAQPGDTASPFQPVAALAPAKKTHKTMLIVLGAVLVLALASGYAIYALMSKSSSSNKPAATTQTETAAPTTANATNGVTTPAAAVQAATSTLIDSSTAEATTTNTDDSNMATDATNAAGTVGDSVDETKL